LHTFDDIQLGLEGLGFFNGDDTIFADFLHSFGNDATDGLVIVRGNGADLSDVVALDWLRQFVELALAALAGFLVDFASDNGNCFLDAALQGHWIGSGSYGLYAFAVDRLGKNGGGGGAVASDIRGLRSNFADHLRTHVF